MALNSSDAGLCLKAAPLSNSTTPELTGSVMIGQISDSQFSLGQARRIVGDLFVPNERVFWRDFVAAMVVADLLFFGVAFLPMFLTEPSWAVWGIRAAGFLVYSLLYYRCAMFIHELVHIRSDRFTAFRAVWNFFCGTVFLTPTFVYYTHLDHHRRKDFGTERDGEYIPLACRSRWETIAFLMQSFVIPPLAFFRFFVLTPLTWLSPALRRIVHQRASSMIMDPSYIRPLPTPKVLRVIRLQEAICFAWCATIVVSLATFLRPWAVTFLVQGYATAVFIVMLNAIRTTGAHRWENEEGEMTFVEQLLDSVNYPSGWLPELWAPTGTRFHALHHMLPAVPYHNMREAHERLMRELPADALYRQTNEESLWSALRYLWLRNDKRPCCNTSTREPENVQSAA